MRRNFDSRDDEGRPVTFGRPKRLAEERHFSFWSCSINQSPELPGVTIETPNLSHPSPRPSRTKVLGHSDGGQTSKIAPIDRLRVRKTVQPRARPFRRSDLGDHDQPGNWPALPEPPHPVQFGSPS